MPRKRSEEKLPDVLGMMLAYKKEEDNAREKWVAEVLTPALQPILDAAQAKFPANRVSLRWWNGHRLHFDPAWEEDVSDLYPQYGYEDGRLLRTNSLRMNHPELALLYDASDGVEDILGEALELYPTIAYEGTGIWKGHKVEKED